MNKTKKAKVESQFINTVKLFKWRIIYGKEKSLWASSYSSLLVHKFKDGRTFALATAYWENSLPIEKPFEIIFPIK